MKDSEEMFVLEAQVNRMLPLIDSELECVDRNHAKLTQLSTNLVEAINMYHILMRESESLGSPHLYRQPLYGVPHHSIGKLKDFRVDAERRTYTNIHNHILFYLSSEILFHSGNQFVVNQLTPISPTDALHSNLNPNIIQHHPLTVHQYQPPINVPNTDQYRQMSYVPSSFALNQQQASQQMIGYIPNTVMTSQIQENSQNNISQKQTTHEHLGYQSPN